MEWIVDIFHRWTRLQKELHLVIFSTLFLEELDIRVIHILKWNLGGFLPCIQGKLGNIKYHFYFLGMMCLCWAAYNYLRNYSSFITDSIHRNSRVNTHLQSMNFKILIILLWPIQLARSVSDTATKQIIPCTWTKKTMSNMYITEYFNKSLSL